MKRFSGLQEPLEIKKLLFQNRVWLAPMAGVAGKAFRTVCEHFGAGGLITEMVSVKGLIMGNATTLEMIRTDQMGQVPTGLQLFGSVPQDFSLAIKIIKDLGWRWVDLNAGCPVRKVTKTGAGAALLLDLARLESILEVLRAGFEGLLSVKIRAAWDIQQNPQLVLKEVGRIVDRTGVDMVILHARTRAQGYSGRARWEWIRMLREHTRAVVVGNGDVRNLEDAQRMMEQTGADGVMIGRAAMGAPWVFSGKEPSPEVLENVILWHFDLLCKEIGDEERAARAFRAHLAKYCRGVKEASRLRSFAVKVTTRKDVEEFAGMLRALKEAG